MTLFIVIPLNGCNRPEELSRINTDTRADFSRVFIKGIKSNYAFQETKEVMSTVIAVSSNSKFHQCHALIIIGL